MSALAPVVSTSSQTAKKVLIPQLFEVLPSIVQSFQGERGKWIASHCQHLVKDGVHYYGIRKNNQMQANVSHTLMWYRTVKSVLLSNMGLDPMTKVVQIIGDSAAFSQEGTERAKAFLTTRLDPQTIALYGYTGHAEADGTRCTNAAVSDIMKERLQCAVGNLVGFHTPLAMKNWGCTGPALNHYIVVYGDDESCRERGTVFGDDVTTSDYLSDRLLVLDGGAQTFRQVCNALLLKQKIEVLSGLRSAERGNQIDIVDGASTTTPYFAASKFLQDLAALQSPSEEQLQEFCRNYFGQGKCYVGNPKKPDFDTKQGLFNEAWKLFTKERLDRKLTTLVTFHPS
jgi:hypothetical protein